MNKEDVRYTCTQTYTMEYYSVMKERKQVAICHNIHGSLEDIILSKLNQSEKDILYDITYM